MGVTEMQHRDASQPAEAKKTVPSSSSVSHLALVIGEERYLVDLAEAGEIVPMPPAILPVPLTHDWFMGVVNVRGTLFTVVDFSRFMGGRATPLSKESRLVTISPSLQFNTTLVVSRMAGLRSLATMTPENDKSADDKPWMGQPFKDAEGHVWRRLSLSKLVSSSAFLMVGR